MDEVDDTELKEERWTRQHSLVDSDLEKRAFKFKMSNFNNSLFNENVEYVLTELKSAARVTLH